MGKLHEDITVCEVVCKLISDVFQVELMTCP